MKTREKRGKETQERKGGKIEERDQNEKRVRSNKWKRNIQIYKNIVETLCIQQISPVSSVGRAHDF